MENSCITNKDLSRAVDNARIAQNCRSLCWGLGAMASTLFAGSGFAMVAFLKRRLPIFERYETFAMPIKLLPCFIGANCWMAAAFGLRDSLKRRKALLKLSSNLKKLSPEGEANDDSLCTAGRRLLPADKEVLRKRASSSQQQQSLARHWSY
jgi:hypothetical protein